MRLQLLASYALLVGVGVVGCARRVGAPIADAALQPAVRACAVDFDTTYAIVTRDYAGYQDRMGEGAARITRVRDSVRAALATVTSDSACTTTIQSWVALFGEHDRHLQLWQPRSEPVPSPTPNTPTEERRLPSLTFVDDSTAIITLPSFDRRYKPAIDSLMDVHRTRLLATPYLVVDLRRNGGGADASFRSVMALLYTDPIQREGFDVWLSEGIVAEARPLLDDPRIDAETRVEMREAIRRFEAGGRRGMFFEGSGGEIRYDSVFAMPRAVAVLTGRGCASSCEQFVLDASYSRKVTVYGTGNTAGFLDYGNARQISLPSGVRRLSVPSTRSRRLPNRPMDWTGITPQILISTAEPDPIKFVIRHLKAGTRRE